MQTRLRIGLALGAIIIPGLVLFAASPAKAQSRSDRHYYCDGRARNYADRNASGGILRGAAEGAAIGAIIGAIAGDAGEGAAIGAALGAAGGTTRQRKSRKSLYRREYNRCMRRNRSR